MKPPRMLDIEEMWQESGLWAAKDITVPLINFYLTGAVMCLSELFKKLYAGNSYLLYIPQMFPDIQKVEDCSKLSICDDLRVITATAEASFT